MENNPNVVEALAELDRLIADNRRDPLYWGGTLSVVLPLRHAESIRAVLATAHSPSSTEGRETLPCITGCGSAAMMPDSEYCSECAASHRPSEASTAKTTVLRDPERKS